MDNYQNRSELVKNKAVRLFEKGFRLDGSSKFPFFQ
jgi:hypothetical protein